MVHSEALSVGHSTRSAGSLVGAALAARHHAHLVDSCKRVEGFDFDITRIDDVVYVRDGDGAFGYVGG
mgnify:FL=1